MPLRKHVLQAYSWPFAVEREWDLKRWDTEGEKGHRGHALEGALGIFTFAFCLPAARK